MAPIVTNEAKNTPTENDPLVSSGEARLPKAKSSATELRQIIGSVKLDPKTISFTVPQSFANCGSKSQIVRMPGHIAPQTKNSENNISMPESVLKSFMFINAKSPNASS